MICTQQSFTDSEKAVGGFRKVIEMTWARLDQASRDAILKQIATAAENAKTDRYKLDMLRLELTVKGDLIAEVAKDAKLLTNVLAQRARNAAELKPWLAAMDPKQRPEAVKTALELQSEENRRRYLLELLCEVDSLDDAALLDTIVDLFNASPRMKVREETAYSQLTRVPWYRLETPAGKAAAAKIAEKLLEDHGPMTCVATLYAISTCRACPKENKIDKKSTETKENNDEAQAVMLGAIEQILTQKKLKYHGQKLLEELIKSLPSDDVDALKALLEKQAKQDGMTVSLAFAKAYLNEKMGNTKENLAALKQVFVLGPSDMMNSRGYIDMMQKLGRYAELADTLSDNLKEASIMQSYQWRTLSDLYYQLHRFDEAIRAAKKDDTPLSPLRIIGIEATRNDSEGTLRELRRFFHR